MPDLPPLPLDAWRDTRTTLHLWLQVVGKVRLALQPPQNHWWHVPLYVSARGVATGAMPAGSRTVELELDLVDPGLEARSSDGRVERFALRDGLSVAAFHRGLAAALAALGVEARIDPRPYDPDRVGSRTPFPDDAEPARFDADAARRFWHALRFVDATFAAFRGRFVGKCSPVHLFWHSLDLAHTRFSGRAAPLSSDDPVAREAYSHELVSFGFWAGDDAVPRASFYAYAHPAPDGVTAEPLEPEGAAWSEASGSPMALLAWDDVRAAPDPRAALLAFLESAYRALAGRAGWDLAALAHASAP